MDVQVTGYTRHGHRVDGVPLIAAQPQGVARCGGWAVCSVCYADGVAQRQSWFDMQKAADPGPERTKMKRFLLNRLEDSTGVSGIGVIAEGVMFSDGRVVTRWITGVAQQTCVWDSLEDMKKVHGHNGQTEIVWMDT